jgi:hypothetical protein
MPKSPFSTSYFDLGGTRSLRKGERNLKKVSDLTGMIGEKDPKEDRKSQNPQKEGLEIKKENLKELVKRKLKRVHEEIIAPPGQ